MSTRYFDEGFATVEYDDEIGVIVVEMTEYVEGDQFREYMRSIIDAVEDTGCPNVLADTRDHPPLADRDVDWSAETWGPKAEEAGVERIAALATEHVATKITLDTVTEQSTHDDIDRKYFAKYYEAIEWLKSETA